MDMHEDSSGLSAAQDGTPAAHRLARRRMLRRSLGVAAPVVLTLASAPVAAGSCVSASSFVSAATFASRAPKGVSAISCSGQSPASWAASHAWPAGVDRNTATFAEKLGEPPLAAFPSTATLLDVLQQPSTLEAHIAAVWLSAYAGTLAPPFEDGDAVRALWSNIRGNGGFFRPDNAELRALTEQGTLQWLAMTWQ
ncbi:hypothetical protein [Azohydromonas lata]|uniref:Uncharacterized protein n=1 Tax=Azohydromonas lata TaxID=45677 RepID=A0ABU5IGQ7_9BURK|nr:hypothetical protein [Azohydromonas lata]MDZ5457830.1 hypothetical protein [Azohydromonas lata]